MQGHAGMSPATAGPDLAAQIMARLQGAGAAAALRPELKGPIPA